MPRPPINACLQSTPPVVRVSVNPCAYMGGGGRGEEEAAALQCGCLLHALVVTHQCGVLVLELRGMAAQPCVVPVTV